MTRKMTQEEHERYIRRCLSLITASILWVLLLGICVAGFGIYTASQERDYNPQKEHLEHHREEGKRLDRMILALEALKDKKTVKDE